MVCQNFNKIHQYLEVPHTSTFPILDASFERDHIRSYSMGLRTTVIAEQREYIKFMFTGQITTDKNYQPDKFDFSNMMGM